MITSFLESKYSLTPNITTPELTDAKQMAHIIVDGWKTAYKNILPQDFLDNLSYDIREKRIQDSILGINPKFKSDIVIYKDNKVKGVAFYGKNICNLPENYGEIIVLYVDINEKRKGIGKILVDYIKNELKHQGMTNMIIWCLKDNLPSIEFYKAMGGVVTEERDFEIDGKIYKEVGIRYEL